MLVDTHSAPLLETITETAPPEERSRLLERLSRAKRAFVTRRANFEAVHGLTRKAVPQPGDLVLATITELGHHQRIEAVTGRRGQLYVGDEVVLAYGARYAPDQFEAIVPSKVGACHLVAGGGIAAEMRARHSKARRPTEISPVGILTDAGGAPINLSRFALPREASPAPAVNVIAVVGTSMNAGKTTLAANIIRGLSAGGIRVGACKVTGTGSGGDLWSMLDAGAAHALDFTDMGYATTAGVDVPELARDALALIAHLEGMNTDVVVVEIADGLFQRETAALLSEGSSLAARLDGIFLAAADAMGAFAGAQWLRERKLPLRAVSGLVTASPLAMREAALHAGVEVAATHDFADSTIIAKFALRRADAPEPWSVIS